MTDGDIVRVMEEGKLGHLFKVYIRIVKRIYRIVKGSC